MTSLETSHFVEAYRERCEDRIDVIADGDRTLIVVADGAGGTGDGHIAAETVIRETRANYTEVHTSTNYSKFLSQLDFRVNTGESTAVILRLCQTRQNFAAHRSHQFFFRAACLCRHGSSSLRRPLGRYCNRCVSGASGGHVPQTLLDLRHETQFAEN